ncbi:uncharacterized protein LOC135370409 isoform X2 [Ornithodoros turicata]|uniref:uncharacterized protein LOC135370409 isoform X2 n=1 Tax=Ornithodoros turicata TaxID=34597 RepID=UPI003138E497
MYLWVHEQSSKLDSVKKSTLRPSFIPTGWSFQQCVGTHSPITVKDRIRPVAFALFGYAAPLYMIPLLPAKTTAASCAYFIIIVILWHMLSVLPAPVASMMLILLFTFGETLDEEVAIASYVSPYMLHVVAAMIVVGASKSTKLFDRAAIVVLRNHGARIRSLLLGFAGVALILTVFLDNSVTTLVMVTLIERATHTIQDSTIQGFHKKALFNKVTRRYSRSRRKTLEDIYLRDLDSMAEIERSAHNYATEDYDGARRSEIAAAENSPTAESGAAAPFVTTTVPKTPPLVTAKRKARVPLAPSVSPRTTPSTTTTKDSKTILPRTVNRLRRSIAIMERGQVVVPGTSSPAPSSLRATSPTTSSHRRSTAFSIYDTVALREVASWERERYSVIQRDLIVSAVMVTVIGSMVSTTGNMATLFLFSYLEMRFEHKVIPGGAWIMILFPVVGDAEEDEHARTEISKVLEKRRENLGTMNVSEGVYASVPVIVLAVWALASKLFFTGSYHIEETGAERMLVIDYLVVLVLVVMPQKSRPVTDAAAATDTASPSSREAPHLRVTTAFVNWHAVLLGIRWGPLIIHGSVSSVGKAVQVSGIAHWVHSALDEFHMLDPTAIQVILATMSSVLTEVVSIQVTVPLLVPIVIELALKMRFNPLYFAIPVVVAASTTLILPTAAIAVAILDDTVNISRRKLLVQGVVIKAVTIVSLLFSMNTVGDALFSWSEVPAWAQTVENINSSLNLQIP